MFGGCYAVNVSVILSDEPGLTIRPLFLNKLVFHQLRELHPTTPFFSGDRRFNSYLTQFFFFKLPQ